MKKEKRRDANGFYPKKHRDEFDPDEFLKPPREAIRLERGVKLLLKVLLILFIINLIMVIIMYPYMYDSLHHDLGPNTPIATLLCNNRTDGNWSIRVSSIEPWTEFENVIVTVYTNETEIFSALLSDIHNEPDNYTEVRFINSDNNSKLSSGDILILNTQSDGLTLERNSTIRLSYTRTKKTIGRIYMKDYIPKS